MIRGLLSFGRYAAQASVTRGPSRPPQASQATTTCVAWAVVVTIVVAFLWWPVLVIAGIGLLICGLTAHDRKTGPRTDTLAELLANYDDNGRRKS